MRRSLPASIAALAVAVAAVSAVAVVVVVAPAVASAVFPSAASVPDPPNCSVEPCDTINGVVTSPFTGAPPAAIEFTVNIRNSGGQPIPSLFVEMVFDNPVVHHFCSSVILTGITDANGDVDFALAVGGCSIAANAIRIRANNVDIRSYPNCKSPDLTADGRVGLPDFVQFGSAFHSGASGCTDYNNDGGTNLQDFSTYGTCHGRTCP